MVGVFYAMKISLHKCYRSGFIIFFFSLGVLVVNRNTGNQRPLEIKNSWRRLGFNQFPCPSWLILAHCMVRGLKWLRRTGVLLKLSPCPTAVGFYRWSFSLSALTKQLFWTLAWGEEGINTWACSMSPVSVPFWAWARHRSCPQDEKVRSWEHSCS